MDICGVRSVIYGHGSLGEVTLRIIEDFTYEPDNHWYGGGPRLLSRPRNRLSGYTLAQFIQVVVHEQRSILSIGSSPSYIWWHLGIGRDGEIEPMIDLGKRSPVFIKCNDRKRSTRPIRSNRGMMVHEKLENDGKWELVSRIYDEHQSFHSDGDYIMLKRGMSFGQQFLTRYEAEYFTSSSGEYEEIDLREYGEIIYASVPRRHDIPFSVANTLPAFRGFRS